MRCGARFDVDQDAAMQRGAYCANAARAGKTRGSRGRMSVASQRPWRGKGSDPATMVVGRGGFRCRLHALRCMRQGMSNRNHRARKRWLAANRFHARRMHFLRRMRRLLPPRRPSAGTRRQHPLVAQGSDHAKLPRVQKGELLKLQRFLHEARHPLSITRRWNPGSRSRS